MLSPSKLARVLIHILIVLEYSQVASLYSSLIHEGQAGPFKGGHVDRAQ